MTNSSDSATAVHPGIAAYLSVAGAVILLMMLLGLLMLLSHGGIMVLPPDLFYQVLTVHGIGMVGIAGLVGSAIMWFFLSRYVQLFSAILWINLALFLIGVVMILGAVFIGGFASAWTFLYPLPAISGGAWENGAAAVYVIGVLLVGVGFLLFFLETGRGILSTYGSLGKALGWGHLFGDAAGDPPPPTVVAATMVTVLNILSVTCGAVILVITLVNIFVPSFTISALLAKNMIFFFGHVFINTTIYMAVYEILPLYADRPWKTNRIFLAAWNGSLLLVLMVFPHHLLMDFAMPTWLLIIGQVFSWVAGLPILVVTAFGALTLVHRSGIKWDLASALLMLSMFGWATGVLPAIIDATVAVNLVMHNTFWVPGHFHFYLLLGTLSMGFGFLYWLHGAQAAANTATDWIAFWFFAIGGVGLVVSYLAAGSASVPRRFAVHLPEWMAYDQLAAVFAVVVILSASVFVGRFLGKLRGGFQVS